MLSMLYLVKNPAGAHIEPSKKYKSNLQTLKSKNYEKYRTKHKYYNNKAPHFFISWTTDFPDLIKVLNMSKTTQAFTSSTEIKTICQDMFYDLKGSFLI